MAGRDWFRNEIWSAEIEADFRARLSRARYQKPQYLKLQAGHLAKKYPVVSLGLIEEYFATGDDFHVSSAYGVRADAFEAMGEIAAAIGALKQALDWEKDHRGVITLARLNYPRLVALHAVESEYEAALAVLIDRFNPSDLTFPSSRYYWNGAEAIILHAQGHHDEAQEFAERALVAATEIESPYRHHRSVGLVKTASDPFGQKLKAIAKPSKVRRLFRLLKPGSG